MEDNSYRSNHPSGLGAFISESGRTESPSSDGRSTGNRWDNIYDDHFYDDATGIKHNPTELARTIDYGSDTAPFNVTAFLNYLDQRDNNFGNEPTIND